MHDIKRILVISRMTRDCKKAIHYGVALANMTGAELNVLHLVQHPIDFDLAGWFPLKAMEREYQIFIQEAKEELDEMIRREKTGGLDIKEEVAEGDPGENVLKMVNEKKIALLVMLAHEQGRVEHFLFGHSIHEIIRKMPCSVVLVKSGNEPAE
jgi:nucleotide-binding universal stress UspA family protein